MFRNKKLDVLLDMVEKIDSRLIEMKIIHLEDRKQIMALTAELRVMKNYTLIKKVKKPRKKALRKASGWTNVSDAEAAGYVKDYEAGLSILEIATQANRSSSTVGNWIHKLTDGVEDETGEDTK